MQTLTDPIARHAQRAGKDILAIPRFTVTLEERIDQMERIIEERIRLAVEDATRDLRGELEAFFAAWDVSGERARRGLVEKLRAIVDARKDVA